MEPHAAYDVADLAYAAGVIDGDGYVCVSRQKRKAGPAYYLIQVGVTMVDQDVPLWFEATFGGHLRLSHPSKKPGNERFVSIWRWDLNGRYATEFLKLVIPYLRLKRYRAELAVELTGTVDWRKLRGKNGLVLPIPPSEVDRRALLARKIRAENQRTNTRVAMCAQEIA